MNRLVVIILFILLTLLSSCFDDGDCTSTVTDILHINFKKTENNEADTVELNGIAFDHIPTVFNADDTTTAVLLPLDPDARRTVITFDFKSAIKKELSIDYTTTPRLISPDCGVELLFDNITVSTHDFDSVAVATTTLDEKITPHLVIYQ